MSARSGMKKSIRDTNEIYEVCLYTCIKNRRLIFDTPTKYGRRWHHPRSV